MSALSRAYRNLRGFQIALNDLGRMREILRVLGRHGFGAVVQRLNLAEVEAIPPTVEGSPEPAPHLTRGQRIRMVIEELGPTFVKFGQILSTRSDLIADDIIEELEKLQDNVPAMPFSDVRAVIESELGRPVEEIFSVLEELPLASASIAQVHCGLLRSTGEEVVIKVQRVRIKAQIESDLHILHFLARRAAAAIPELELMDPVGIMGEFDRAIRRELDFRTESRSIAQFTKNFQGFEGIRAPRVYDDFSSERLLTLERIHGAKVTLAKDTYGLAVTPIAQCMLRGLFKMIFEDGYFHGDLHPGNILIESTGNIVLIDFGLVGRLTPPQREHILDVLVGIARQDYRLVARVFFELGIKQPGVVYDLPAFERDVVELMERHVSNRTLQEVDIGAYFADLVAGAIRHKIRMPPTYTMVFKALMTVEGIGKNIAPDMDFLSEAQPFVERMMVERYSLERLTAQAVETLSGLSRLLKLAPDAGISLVESIRQGTFTVVVEPRGLDKLVAAHRAGARLQAAAIGFVGCVLGLGMLYGRPGPAVSGYHVLPVLFAVAALFFAIPLLRVVLARWK